jgi:hypothetical protein
LELKIKFDKKISLKEFDKQIPRLVNYFPPEISVLIKIIIQKDFIEAILSENPNKRTVERWEWDLNDIAHSNLEDYFKTIN